MILEDLVTLLAPVVEMLVISVTRLAPVVDMLVIFVTFFAHFCHL